jgi:hypothetical protein
MTSVVYVCGVGGGGGGGGGGVSGGDDGGVACVCEREARKLDEVPWAVLVSILHVSASRAAENRR